MKREPGFYRNIVALALPIVLQNLVTSTLAMADTFMVGLLGEIPMAGLTLANIPFYALQMFFFGVQSGSAVLISQYWGKGDRKAINRVLGLSWLTVGVVSALDRAVSSSSYDKYGRKETITNTMIQTDAAINSGNSGGGMFSVTGELMGIPTLKYTGSYYSGASVEGIGMCIPVNAVKPLIDSVLTGEVKAIAPEKDEPEQEASDLRGKPRLGVTIADVNMSSRAASLGQIPDGVFITEVEEGSPAEKAGLIAGDIIVDVNDTIITDDQQLITLVGQYNAGDVLRIKVYRAEGLLERSATQDAPEGEYIDVEVTLEVIASDTEPVQEDEGLLYAQ